MSTDQGVQGFVAAIAAQQGLKTAICDCEWAQAEVRKAADAVEQARSVLAAAEKRAWVCVERRAEALSKFTAAVLEEAASSRILFQAKPAPSHDAREDPRLTLNTTNRGY